MSYLSKIAKNAFGNSNHSTAAAQFAKTFMAAEKLLPEDRFQFLGGMDNELSSKILDGDVQEMSEKLKQLKQTLGTEGARDPGLEDLVAECEKNMTLMVTRRLNAHSIEVMEHSTELAMAQAQLEVKLGSLAKRQEVGEEAMEDMAYRQTKMEQDGQAAFDITNQRIEQGELKS